MVVNRPLALTLARVGDDDQLGDRAVLSDRSCLENVVRALWPKVQAETNQGVCCVCKPEVSAALQPSSSADLEAGHSSVLSVPVVLTNRQLDNLAHRHHVAVILPIKGFYNVRIFADPLPTLQWTQSHSRRAFG